ncbi:MAG: flavodoxin domain-containing protein, partial [Chloroflexota bacterium]
MNETISSALIVYGTRWGGTTDVSNKIGDTLRKMGFEVNVVEARRKVPSISNYNFIIVGSGIR